MMVSAVPPMQGVTIGQLEKADTRGDREIPQERPDAAGASRASG